MLNIISVKLDDSKLMPTEINIKNKYD